MLFLNKQTNCKELDKFNLLQEIEETLLSYRIDGINNRDNFILFAIKLNQIEKSKTNFTIKELKKYEKIFYKNLKQTLEKDYKDIGKFSLSMIEDNTAIIYSSTYKEDKYPLQNFRENITKNMQLEYEKLFADKNINKQTVNIGAIFFTDKVLKKISVLNALNLFEMVEQQLTKSLMLGFGREEVILSNEIL